MRMRIEGGRWKEWGGRGGGSGGGSGVVELHDCRGQGAVEVSITAPRVHLRILLSSLGSEFKRESAIFRAILFSKMFQYTEKSHHTLRKYSEWQLLALLPDWK